MTSTPASGGADAATLRNTQLANLARTDMSQARRVAAKARADGVRSAVVHHLVSLELKDAGRFDEAIEELGLGLELEPNHAGMMITVGYCLIELGRHQEAARVLGTAMRLDPRSAEAAYAYGCAAERLAALDTARSAFERAVALQPDNADALAGIAGLAIRRRDFERARSFAERSIAINARQTDALTSLARIALGEEDFEGARARLESLVELPFLKPLARPNVRLLLGDALDGLGRYQDAYAAYARGKAELAELYAPQLGQADTPAAPEIVRAMLAEFLETPAEGWKAPGRPVAHGSERGHAFLIGFPRSGTTLLEQVIATHPDMVALGERPIMRDAESEFMSGPGGLTRLAGVLADLLEPYRAAYWSRVRAFGVDPNGKVFVDKHPLSTMRVPLINKIFPEAKIIFATRDPRDVVLSCFRRSFTMNANMYEFNTIAGAARLYDAVMTAGEAYFGRLPVKVHRVHHEDVVADFERTIGGLCEFLGVEWTPKLRDFANTDRAIATPSGIQIAKGLDADRVGLWRNYAFALEPVMPILAPWIEKFCYAGS
jgi:tetratricopeptide (TPR) repeat protein